ncbi:MAG TPA: UDP-glucose/GDP-mannose dehydrogenase family protein [Candidatus Saccharimonadales bacterium]|nr:UDP-glucose/GDP-mannose dehydrogenase family protein [Candidatus Saccharimonadales bacterium]
MITQNTNQKILIVGTGYVGLITALGLAKLGNIAACVDINPDRVAGLRAGKAPFYEPQVNGLIAEMTQAGRISFFESLAEAYDEQRYIFVGVQTPQDANGKSDLSILRAAITSIAKALTKPALVVVKSTVPVGVFDELAQMPAVKAKMDLITFVSCPEFLAEGTAVRDFFNPMRTIVGSDDQAVSEEVAGLFYGLGGTNIVTDAKTAQMIKYSANSFLATRVAFINDVAEICEKVNVSVHDVAKALVMDPRVGGSYLSPSIGFAGPCLPKDIAALIETSERVGAPVLLLRGASEHNQSHIRHVIDTIIAQLGAGTCVAVFGLSFKPNTDDVRNAYSFRIIEALLERGITVQATDPQAIPAAQRILPKMDLLTFAEDPYETAKNSDLQLFLTPWDDYKQLDLQRLAKVVKTQNIYDAMQVVSQRHAYQAGFAYRGIGDVADGNNSPVFAVSQNPAAHK